jgi:hypothetical protein
MIGVFFETKKDETETLKRVVQYFVEDVGLKITEQGSCCVSFEDEKQLGYVNVTLNKKRDKFEVDDESKEVEYHTKKL